MIHVLFIFLYSFIICLGMGFALPFKTKSLAIHLIFGMFMEMLLLHFWLAFSAADELFYGINLTISLGLIAWNWKVCKVLFYAFYWDIARIPWSHRWITFGFCVLVLMQSSVAPYLIDNESYYLQSIRWLNEHGLVKGLANLHIYFGQMSGWHVLQSGLNFGFQYQLFNDLNGFLMMVYVLFVVTEFHKSTPSQLPKQMLLGVFIVSPFLFQFISAPSADLVVYLFSPIIIYCFLENRPWQEMFIPALVITLSKITAFPILIFPLIAMFRENRKSIPTTFLIFSSLSLLAFSIKNYLVSGYPLYPLSTQPFAVDWAIPDQMQEFYYRYTKMHAYLVMDWETFKDRSFFWRLSTWLTNPKLHGFFNVIMVSLLVIFPILGRFNKKWKVIYFFGLVQFIILFVTSPQYRFFFHIILIFSLLIGIYQFSKWLPRFKYLIIAFAFSPLIILSTPIDVGALTNNDFMKTGLKTFELKQAIIPHKNSQYKYPYKYIQEGNLIFQTPVNTHFWLSGDGKPPVVNILQINSFKDSLKIVPQLRDSTSVGKGFYSKEIQHP